MIESTTFITYPRKLIRITGGVSLLVGLTYFTIFYYTDVHIQNPARFLIFIGSEMTADKFVSNKTNVTLSLDEEAILNSSEIPFRGIGDSQLPIEDRLTFSYITDNYTTDLYSDNPKGVDPLIQPNLKKILFWNDVFGKRHFGLGYGQEPFLRAGCRVNTCMTTANRKLFKMKDIDALIWHFRSDDRSLPPIRYPHIYYVFYMMESASYTYGDLKRFKNIFNLVFTYRQDSDFYNPYGYIYRRRLPLPIEDFQNIAASKTKLAAWFVSHCETVGKREWYVKDLQRWMPIDVYGACGPLTCDNNKDSHWQACYDMLGKDYKFYLSFENSLCTDYATEKFFNALKVNVVPVVFGVGNYHLYAPPHSYINAMDFPSEKKLAEYLLYLHSNDTAYNEYFQWKPYHKVRSNWYHIVPFNWDAVVKPWCDLCERLHRNETKKVYDLYQWFVQDAHCLTVKKVDQLTALKKTG